MRRLNARGAATSAYCQIAKLADARDLIILSEGVAQVIDDVRNPLTQLLTFTISAGEYTSVVLTAFLTPY